MTDDVSKLPAWPERKRGQLPVNYNHDLADAYRARMEALVEVVREYRDEIWKSQCEWEKLELIDALLAACRRDGDQEDGVRGEREEGR
jgi:hypothetical protein